MEPVAKVPVGGVVENHHTQDDESLQHQQRVIFCGKVMEQFGFGEERLLRGRAAGKAAGGQHICRRMETSWCQYDAEEEQRAVAGLIVANEISSIDYGSKRVDVVKICFNEGISVVFACE